MLPSHPMPVFKEQSDEPAGVSRAVLSLCVVALVSLGCRENTCGSALALPQLNIDGVCRFG